jgi:peptidoglycan/LPS O-acetylase OafA/YrhL
LLLEVVGGSADRRGSGPLFSGLQLQKDDQKHNIAVLDGVRAIACLSVVAFHINLIAMSYHLWQPYPASNFLVSAIAMQGGSGVTLFFVLSGFLLFMPYAKALLFAGEQWPSIKRFYVRRIFRIWPGYYVALILLVVLSQPQYLTPAHLPELGLFTIFLMDSTKQTFQQLNGPFWTLAIEWQYYMLLPFIALGFHKLVGSGSIQQRWWRLMACLGALAAWGVLSRWWGFYFVIEHPNATFLVPRPVLNVILFIFYGYDGKFLEDFAVGMLVSSCFVLVQRRTPENTLSWFGDMFKRYSYWIFGAGLAVLIFMTLWNGNERYHAIAFFEPLFESYNWLSEFGLSVGYGLCILALLFGTSQLRLPFEWAPLRGIGLISYSMYMWHLPLLGRVAAYVQFIQAALPPWLTYLLYWVVGVLLVVIPFSYALYKWIERPGIRLGNKLLQKRQEKKKLSVKVQEEEKNLSPALANK